MMSEQEENTLVFILRECMKLKSPQDIVEDLAQIHDFATFYLDRPEELIQN